jgi:hypothetical protein
MNKEEMYLLIEKEININWENKTKNDNKIKSIKK